MSFYYPQAAVTLRVVWEDFQWGSSAAKARITTIANITPKRVTVNINDYTQADTFSLELDYKSFPFDPRTIRALGVTLYIEDVGALVGEDGLPKQIKPGSHNVVFQGFADEENITLNESSRTIRIEGRDFTAIYIDAEYPEDAVETTDPLDEVIQDIIDKLPATGKITVDNRTGGDLPTLAKFAPDYNDSTSGKKNVKSKESYWDVIQDLCSRAGVICYIELDKLVITKPRALYSRAKAWQFVYGKNVKSLEFKRKIGRQKGFNIAVRSLNLKNPSQPVLTAKIPEEAKKDWLKALGLSGKPIRVKKPGADGDKDEDWEVAPYQAFLVPKIADKDHLIEIGQQLFEELGRQAIEGSFETREMSTRQGGSEAGATTINLTKFKCGTPVRIEIAHADLLAIRRAATVAERTKYLLQHNYPKQVAQLFAQNLGKFDTPFYTKEVEMTLDAESGFSLKIGFINFIEVSRILGQ